MKKNKSILKILFILCILIYVAIVFINQQQTLNEYSKNTESLNEQIATEKSNNE